MLSRRTRLPHPVDLALTLAPLAHGRGDPCVRIGPAGVWRAARTPDGPGTEHLRVTGGHLEVDAWGPGAPWLIETAPALCGLTDDDSTFRPPPGIVRDLHRRMPGLRIGASALVLEILVPTILEQKVVGAGARRAYRSLVGALGEPAPGPPVGLLVPPAADDLARLPYWRLHPFGVERRRAETIRVAASYATRLEDALGAGSLELRRRIAALPGIGRWSEAIVARIAAGDADAVETGDYHLPNTVAWALAEEERADDERMLELLEPYRGHRGRVVALIEASGLGAPRRGPRLAVEGIANL